MDWERFLNSDVWKALLFEFESREKYLIELFKESDKEWPPDVIKGKLNELDFVRQVPNLILMAIKDSDKPKKERDDAELDG